MDREVVQDLVLGIWVTVVAVQAPGSKVIKVIKAIKAIRVATINSQVKGVSSSNPGIRVT